MLDLLTDRRSETFAGQVYRATGTGYDPTIFSAAGGRWMRRDGMSVLYTSIEREGALAEMSFRLGMLTPVPSKPIVLHRLEVKARKMIRISKPDFHALNIDPSRYGDLDYLRTQEIGEAIAFLEFDAMLVPSARWPCDNLVLLGDHQELATSPTVLESEQVEWIPWAKANGFLDDDEPA
ncbi:MAG: RES family NAD+ phosphorylase [Burkholderiales bacterium]